MAKDISPKHYKKYPYAYKMSFHVLIGLFFPKEVHFEGNIYNFLTFILMNFFVRTLQFCICFPKYENTTPKLL